MRYHLDVFQFRLFTFQKDLIPHYLPFFSAPYLIPTVVEGGNFKISTIFLVHFYINLHVLYTQLHTHQFISLLGCNHVQVAVNYDQARVQEFVRGGAQNLKAFFFFFFLFFFFFFAFQFFRGGAQLRN